jgi:hypothetical protein
MDGEDIDITAPTVFQGLTAARIEDIQLDIVFFFKEGLQIAPEAGIIQAGGGGYS